jgi:hypothetical protein
MAWEEGIFIVQEHDHQSLCLMLLKCYEQLHHFSKASNVSQSIQRNINMTSSFNIFEMASCGVELALEHVNCELLSFQQWQVYVNNIKCPLQWYKKCKIMFFTMACMTNIRHPMMSN